MNRSASGAGWTINPTYVTWFISLLMATGGSYLAMQRDDGKEVRAQLMDHAHRLAVTETEVRYLKRAEERRQDRERVD